MTKRMDGPSSEVRIRVMKRDRFRCTYCGVPGTDAELEIDHIVAVAKGGSHHISNLTTSCRKCNQEKGTSDKKPFAPNVKRMSDHPLVGKWLHTLKDGSVIEWQAEIIGVDGDVVIVQLYEWFAGCASQIATLPKADVYDPSKCRLYPTNEHMNEYYERYSRSQGDPYAYRRTGVASGSAS